jgi:uncharacterized membrane protein
MIVPFPSPCFGDFAGLLTDAYHYSVFLINNFCRHYSVSVLTSNVIKLSPMSLTLEIANFGIILIEFMQHVAGHQLCVIFRVSRQFIVSLNRFNGYTRFRQEHLSWT